MKGWLRPGGPDLRRGARRRRIRSGEAGAVWRQVLLPLNVNYSCRFGRLLVRRRTVRWALLRVLKTQKTKRRERPLGDVHGSAVAERAASEGRGWWLLREPARRCAP